MSLFARPYPLSGDAAVVIGFAGTAISFARSREDEAERWLRALRLHGEAGQTLQALGVPESSLEATVPAGVNHHATERGKDVVGSVTHRAASLAHERGASVISTADVLRSLLDEYGECFDRLLESRGTSRAELLQCLAAHERAASAAEATRGSA